MAVQQAPAWRIKIVQLYGSCLEQFYLDSWFFTLCGIWLNFFLKKKVCRQRPWAFNIKSSKSMQYNLQAKTFDFHGCLIANILNIFCIVPYAKMIMALLKQWIGSTGIYTILTIALCNDLLEKNNLTQRICMCRCTSW